MEQEASEAGWIYDLELSNAIAVVSHRVHGSVCEHRHTHVQVCAVTTAPARARPSLDSPHVSVWVKVGPKPGGFVAPKHVQSCGGREDTAVLGTEESRPALQKGAECLPSITEAGTSLTWPHFSALKGWEHFSAWWLRLET